MFCRVVTFSPLFIFRVCFCFFSYFSLTCFGCNSAISIVFSDALRFVHIYRQRKITRQGMCLCILCKIEACPNLVFQKGLKCTKKSCFSPYV